MTLRWPLVVAGVVLLALLVGNVVATHNVLTEPHPGHNDFLTVWEAARSALRDGLDPYSAATTLNIQQRIYGRPAEPDEFPNYYAYPYYTLFLVSPLVYSPYPWASAIAMVALEVCLIAALVLLLDLYGWRPRPWLLALLLLWVLTFYYAARGLLLGQVSHAIYLLHVLALWALARRYDALVGAALALSTMKPQMGFLLVPLLLLWALRVGRWRLIGVFAGVFGALMLASFTLEPGWMGGWLDQVDSYTGYTRTGSPVWVVMQYYLGLGDVGEWALNALLWLWLAWVWYGVLLRDQAERLDWAVMLTLTITHLSALRTATPHFVVFTVPLVFYLRRLDVQRRKGWIVGALALLLIVPWAHFLLTVDDGFEHPSLYLLVPYGALLLLWLTRRWWWAAPPVLNRVSS